MFEYLGSEDSQQSQMAINLSTEKEEESVAQTNAGRRGGLLGRLGALLEEGQTLRIATEDSDSGEMNTDDVMHTL